MPEEIQQPQTPPAAPETPQTPPTPPAEAEDTDAAEWDEAARELYPNLEKKETETSKEDGQETETTTTTTTAADPADPKKPEEKPAEGQPSAPAAPDTAQQREIQRQMAAEFESVKKDVAEALFKDLPLELKDADGDPIKGVEDVMKLIDPRTKEPFTEEAATAWLSYHQKALEKAIADADAEANRITTVNIGLKDDSDRLQKDFSDVIKAHPEAMKSLWDQYSKTLTVDQKSGVVLKAPVSLYEFVKTGLSPYADMAKVAAEADAAKKAAEAAANKQNRSSRSDIFGSGKVDNLSDEDKEWAEAAQDYYGSAIK